MKLSELNYVAKRLDLPDDVDLIIELDDRGAGAYTGVITAGKVVSGHGTTLLNLLPAACLKPVPFKEEAERVMAMGGVSAEEKRMLWKNIK
jgi:hypothetical protein